MSQAVTLGQKKAALYIRRSTGKQDISFEMQLRDLEPWAARKGYDYDIYRDTYTGGKATRPGLEAMMAKIKKGRYDALFVWKYDRLGRSAVHLILTINELDSLGVDFLSFTEGADTTTPQGKLLFTILAGFAEFELARITERNHAMQEAARGRGSMIGPPGRRLKVTPEGEPVVWWRGKKRSETREIGPLYLPGPGLGPESLRAAAKRLSCQPSAVGRLRQLWKSAVAQGVLEVPPARPRWIRFSKTGELLSPTNRTEDLLKEPRSERDGHYE